MAENKGTQEKETRKEIVLKVSDIDPAPARAVVSGHRFATIIRYVFPLIYFFERKDKTQTLIDGG